MNKNLLLPGMIVIILAVSAVYIFPAHSAPPSTAIGISPAETRGVPTGGTFKVNITLSNVKELFGWDGTFTYHPRIICSVPGDPIIFDIDGDMVYSALGETQHWLASFTPVTGSALKYDARLVYFDSLVDGQFTPVLESVIVDENLNMAYDFGERVVGAILPPAGAGLRVESRINYYDLNGDSRWSDDSSYFRYLIPGFNLPRAPTLDCESGTVAAAATSFPLPSSGLTGSFDAAEMTFVVLAGGFETPLHWVPESVKFNVNCGIQCREFEPTMRDGFVGSAFSCQWEFVGFKIAFDGKLTITARVQNKGADSCIGVVRHVIKGPEGLLRGFSFDSPCTELAAGETKNIVTIVPGIVFNTPGDYMVESFNFYDGNGDGILEGPNAPPDCGNPTSEYFDRISPSEFDIFRDP